MRVEGHQYVLANSIAQSICSAKLMQHPKSVSIIRFYVHMHVQT